MPTKFCTPATETIRHSKSLSYESQTATWLLQDGWEVLLPMIDHGLKTDVVISDGYSFYRIQVKSLETSEETTWVENKWGDAPVDFVVYFSRTSHWGYIMPAFKESRRRLNAPGHIRFHQDAKPFIKAFNRL
ncbi:group I intron-associated PD-(D/E)XK endonuclease [Agarivorans gilvus]|uniref:PD(D/E)XK endonuclease domain-containing protein n=1 Tax=Agarivorans gilvus TaxID=680279 RepID=A0ABQ1HXY2_9ALTE|nr:group I intron-associated PD-(D/E)XK endonuclease [Agarivorans gilvus]GGA94993.1 hypothetical protein GCM10007414_04680 [Agarivorans gilvus]